MGEIILYLLESSLVLICLYTLYFIFLKKQTFFIFNRVYLIAILLISFFLPLTSFNFYPMEDSVIQRPMNEIKKLRSSYNEVFLDRSAENGTLLNNTEVIKSLSYSHPIIPRMSFLLKVIFGIYLLGVVFCLLRAALAINRVFKIVSKSPKNHIDGLVLVHPQEKTAPFSFFNYVIINEESMNPDELDHIMKHEQIHVRHKHTIDLIFVQISAAFFWFNPIIWQLIKSLKLTHEYIADEKTISEGCSKVDYQVLLLNQLIRRNTIAMTHNFNLSFIKKRIAMMNIQESGLGTRVKSVAVLVVALLFCISLIQCNSEVDEVSQMTENEFGNIHDYSADSLVITIVDNSIRINGKSCRLNEISQILNKASYSHELPVIIEADKRQKMQMIYDVQKQVRKANRRKLIYREVISKTI